MFIECLTTGRELKNIELSTHVQVLQEEIAELIKKQNGQAEDSIISLLIMLVRLQYYSDQALIQSFKLCFSDESVKMFFVQLIYKVPRILC